MACNLERNYEQGLRVLLIRRLRANGIVLYEEKRKRLFVSEFLDFLFLNFWILVVFEKVSEINRYG